jgi:hypothetical protein
MTDSQEVSTDAYDAEEQFTIYVKRDGDMWVAFEHDADHYGISETRPGAVMAYARQCAPEHSHLDMQPEVAGDD